MTNTITQEKRITSATIKSFIEKNRGNLYIKNESHFDGMTDGIAYNPKPFFHKATETDTMSDYTLGVQGAWFVGSSRDHFTPYEDDEFTGFEVYNSCGTFTLAIKK